MTETTQAVLDWKKIEGALKQPFPAKDVEWRIQQADIKGARKWALVLAYIDNRAIMDRLDEIFGVNGWKNDFKSGPDGGVLCGISIYDVNLGEWVRKWDGAENTDIEKVKGGLSGAMKRAANQWGIGRYLYNLESSFVTLETEKPASMEGWRKERLKVEANKYASFYWKIPQLPEWALPRVKPTQAQVARLIAIAKEMDSEADARRWLEKDHPSSGEVGAAIKRMEKKMTGGVE